MSLRDAADKLSGLLFIYIMVAAIALVWAHAFTEFPFRTNDNGDRIIDLEVHFELGENP